LGRVLKSDRLLDEELDELELDELDELDEELEELELDEELLELEFNELVDELELEDELEFGTDTGYGIPAVTKSILTIKLSLIAQRDIPAYFSIDDELDELDVR